MTLKPGELTLSKRLQLVLAAMFIGIVALIPRLLLAHSLDLITDEAVYIPIGQQDLKLLVHFDIFNAHWLDNFEAPPLPKLFIGLGSLWGKLVFGQSGILFGARLPGVLLSALSLVIAFHLARPIVGTLGAWLGALALALSPWLAYFAALAYLDGYMLIFLTIGVLLTWHAAHYPTLLPFVGISLGLAMASKYTALAGVIPIVSYLVIYHRQTHQPFSRQQGAQAVLAFIVTLFVVDPAIWANPIIRFAQSLSFQFSHATNGHEVFWFDETWFHVVPGMGLLIVLAKMSLFVTIPALVVIITTFVLAIRHRRWPNDTASFLFCWVVGLVIPFSSLTIIVGTHYVLPLAPALAFTGAWGIVLAANRLSHLPSRARVVGEAKSSAMTGGTTAISGVLLVLCSALIILPPLFGLLTIRQAEGYTSEWLRGEDDALQVAYPGYADALDWLDTHTQGNQTIALIALPHTLDYWLVYHENDLPRRFTLITGTPDDVPQADYTVWPEHLIQRRFPHPSDWQSAIITPIKGGNTTYCYILQLRSTASLSSHQRSAQ